MIISDEKLQEYLKVVSYAVGYSIDDPDAKMYIKVLVVAGLEDMQQSGVSVETLAKSALVLPALIIFVNDNLQMTAGNYKTSPMYSANVDKLREGFKNNEG